MARGLENFLQNVLPDLKDNIPSAFEATSARVEIRGVEEAEPLVTRLFTHEKKGDLRPALWELAQQLPAGTHRARVAVGKTEDSTRHPHDFIIERREDEILFHFVDPEHQMGRSRNHENPGIPRKGDVRPKISTLISVRMHEGSNIPEIAMIRFRASALPDKQQLKMGAQLEMAKTLLANEALPDALRDKKREITFRLVVDAPRGNMSIQSRYATAYELNGFLDGGEGNGMLLGKARAFSILMNQFRTHLAEGRFAPLAEKDEGGRAD